MLDIGIRYGVDLLPYSRLELIRKFGKSGNFFYDIVRGVDHRPVQPRQGRKSVGSEVTLKEDVRGREEMLAILGQIAERVETALHKKKLAGKSLILKVRYHDFVTVTRSRTSPCLFATSSDIMDHVPHLLSATEAGKEKVRLLGLTVTNFPVEGKRPAYIQLSLPFPPPKGQGHVHGNLR
jgi:DNA polymerase-4